MGLLEGERGAAVEERRREIFRVRGVLPPVVDEEDSGGRCRRGR